MKNNMNVNWRAVGKVSLIVTVLVLGFVFHHPVLVKWGEWIEDVHEFRHNNTTWENRTAAAQRGYMLWPVMWFAIGCLWYGAVWKMRRKTLIVNGTRDGTVTWIYGHPEYRKGHLYDIACVMHGFKAIPWTLVWRPVAGHYMANYVTIYYKMSALEGPLDWHRLATNLDRIKIGWFRVWVTGASYRLVEHPLDARLNCLILEGTVPYETGDIDLLEFLALHRDTQKRIMEDNYRMAICEPGTARKMVHSSMMAVSSETRENYIDLLTEEELKKYLGEAYAKPVDDE